MNKIFKVVWSRVKHCYVVTSEIARSNGRSKSSRVGTTAKAAVICVFVLSLQGGYASAIVR
ncbi:ESPR domain-containing protein [Veillonella agrestimuris]|uniref:ESPR domain-containing protein n=1 Tax=Veillonella agrestimuris TaxID=2941340 RepID=UPI00203AB0FD|nr:ESPR domain-containing protein [Veillonella agrestimuris]